LIGIEEVIGTEEATTETVGWEAEEAEEVVEGIHEVHREVTEAHKEITTTVTVVVDNPKSSTYHTYKTEWSSRKERTNGSDHQRWTKI
jgi:hypothetical protein